MRARENYEYFERVNSKCLRGRVFVCLRAIYAVSYPVSPFPCAQSFVFLFSIYLEIRYKIQRNAVIDRISISLLLIFVLTLITLCKNPFTLVKRAMELSLNDN